LVRAAHCDRQQTSDGQQTPVDREFFNKASDKLASQGERVLALAWLDDPRFILLNVATGLANVVVLSNVPGYAILVPYAAGDLQGVTPSFGTWGATDYLIGLALGFPIARWLAARFGDYRVYGAALAVYAYADGDSTTNYLLSVTTGEKPPKIMRLPSNGMGFFSGLKRSSVFMSSSIRPIAASRVALSGHSIQEKTTVSSSLA
jgi:MFS family permease